MKPLPFAYQRADTAAQAVAALAAHGDEARILAGGQSLVPALNMRLAQAAVLVDISRSTEMADCTLDAQGLTVGAAVTQAQVQALPGLEAALPLLAQALPWISHAQIRNRGTVCGSLAHADPSAELPLVLLALRGEVELLGPSGSRRVAAEDFFTGLMSTARRNDELLRRAHFPRLPAGVGVDFREFSVRRGDYAACAVAVVATDARLRVAVGGVADRPVACDWPLLEGAALDDALNTLAWDLEARDDPQVGAAARRHLVRRLGRQAVQAALARRQTRP